MLDNIHYIKVNELIDNCESPKNADRLISEIINSESHVIGIDWEKNGPMGAAFFDVYLNNLRSNTKLLINFNLSEAKMGYIRPFIVDGREKHIFNHICNLSDFEFIDNKTLKSIE